MKSAQGAAFVYDEPDMTALDGFIPALLLRNPHLMTLIPRYWSREAIGAPLPQVTRRFTTEPRTQLQGFCHWQSHPRSSPTLILLHGLEGSADSHYMRGMTTKAYRAGFNVIRMNQRTCGGSDHLTPTLYNSGLSNDYRAIIQELALSLALPVEFKGENAKKSSALSRYLGLVAVGFDENDHPV